MTCTHDMAEQDIAVADGCCPLCLIEKNVHLRQALEAMHEEFGAHFPDGERTAVDMAREALKE